ncbi:MAG TPA: nicotinate-nicotinamide nucleotide adenylyltransferase [bacterium]|nr:nicotinate-nicotinamide nucleotide adenylyltransferase [bacterium]
MSNNIKDIAVFGGKFDPPHLAHRMTIDLALEKYKMDEVWLIPSFNHPFGFKTTSFEHRLEMCRILAKQWPEERIKVLETEREINSGFTIDLIRHFIDVYPGFRFHLFIGADNWKNKEKWKEFSDLERICKSIKVIGRGELEFDGSALPDISSTMVKEMIRQNEPVHPFLPEGIEYYIRKNSLYI